MSRRAATDYAGATGRLTLEKAGALSAQRFALQIKHDGMYSRLHLDGQGRIARVLSRTGADVGHNLVGDLIGAFVGWPDSVLVGELEAHTESANRIATTRGYRMVHLFDCLYSGGRYVAKEPYRHRRDQLHRMLAEVINLEPNRITVPTPQGRRDATTGRYSKPQLRGHDRVEIVQQVAPSRANELWADVVERGGGEGLVAVALDAPVGKRGAKKKIKNSLTIDAVCLSFDRRAVSMHWPGGRFVVGRPKSIEFRVGGIFEVLCDGFYESTSQPRFARVIRAREDLR